MNKLITLFCNLCWLLSTLPRWFAFQLSLWLPCKTQQRILRRILRRNEERLNTPFHQRVPQDYESLRPDIEQIMHGGKNVLTEEPILLLEPTGGSSSGTKLIPYTRSLQKEFQRAIDPWIANLFLRWPSLLFGRHYWCITPTTTEPKASAVPIGFDADSAYLGRIQRFIARHTLAVPPKTDPFNTLVHLLNTPDLRLISVWHPSLLTLMMKTMENEFDQLLQKLPPCRARQLRTIGCKPEQIWKKLTVISCWGGETCKPWIEELKTLFPDTIIQAKGLIATEGITSIPLGSTPDIAAVRSHYYEFEEQKTKKILPLWKLKPGQTYQLILTTGGGLCRYRTHDLVTVTGFFHRTPRLHFLTRSNMTSDLFGEKIALAQAEQICNTLPGHYSFAMIAPEATDSGYRYALYLETADSPHQLADHLESRLSENYHYRHARNLGQLEKAAVHRIKNGSEKIICHLSERGQRKGDIKLTALRTELHWSTILSPRTSSKLYHPIASDDPPRKVPKDPNQRLNRAP